MILEHANLSHVLWVESDFVGDGSYDIPFLSPVVFPHFETVTPEMIILGKSTVIPVSTIPTVPSVIAS